MKWQLWEVQHELASQGYSPLSKRELRRIVNRLREQAQTKRMMRQPDYPTR